jgi:hypothetical protein
MKQSTYLCQKCLQLDVLAASRKQYLRLGRNIRRLRYPLLERIDGAEGYGISVEALARMSHSNLQ